MGSASQSFEVQGGGRICPPQHRRLFALKLGFMVISVKCLFFFSFLPKVHLLKRLLRHLFSSQHFSEQYFMASPRNSYLNKKNMDKTLVVFYICPLHILLLSRFFYIALINDKFYNYFL